MILKPNRYREDERQPKLSFRGRLPPFGLVHFERFGGNSQGQGRPESGEARRGEDSEVADSAEDLRNCRKQGSSTGEASMGASREAAMEALSMAGRQKETK